MLDGRSWSGHERNNCFVNLGDGRFADTSFVSGIDFADDGRAVAFSDWDGDGDLDLWLRNRSGPQLRLMRNDHDGQGHFLELRLEGTRSNRDAVGARVEVRAGGKRFVRWVSAGQGYLSQSSRRLHFGLGDAARTDGVTVRWPGGGEQRFAGPAVDRAYRIREGSPEAEALAPREVRLEAGTLDTAADPGPTRVLLRVPLPLPPSVVGALPEGDGSTPATLVNLWAEWCAPCAAELAGFAERYAELRAAGLRVAALSVDAPADRERAAAWFEQHIAPRMAGEAFSSVAAGDELIETLAALMAHVLGRAEEQVLPTSLLVDDHGRLQMVVLGPLAVEQLLADAAEFAVDSEIQASRRTLSHGRWYFRMPRDLDGLAADLEQRGLQEDARFYRDLARSGKSAAAR